MRKDMSKVLKEKSRYDHGFDSGFRARDKQAKFKDLPKRESMTKRYKGDSRKESRWTTQPLKRFLISRLNRSWDKVYSEICHNIKCSSKIDSFIRDSIKRMVVLNVEVVDGKIFAIGECRWRSELSSGEFYVCPSTKTLKRVSTTRQRYRSNPEDILSRNLSKLMKATTGLQCEEDKVFKTYIDKHSGNVIKQNAHAIHAVQDFQSAQWNLGINELYRTFKLIEKSVPLNSEYFKKYRELVYKAHASYVEPPPPFKVGEEVLVTRDYRKTWEEGVVSRVYFVSGIYSYRVTVGKKNFLISERLVPIHQQMRSKPKK